MTIAQKIQHRQGKSKVAPILLVVFIILVFVDGIGVGLWLHEPQIIVETQVEHRDHIVDPANITIEIVCEDTKETKNVTTTSSKNHTSVQASSSGVSSNGVIISGKATTYSRSGCIGCSKDLRMANGETLSDEINTVALTGSLYSTYKNKTVVITNTRTGLSTTAKVTDTGGFGAYGRVADLSLSTSQAVELKTDDIVEIRLEE